MIKARGPIKGIRICDACGFPETQYGMAVGQAICCCNIDDASKTPFGRFSPLYRTPKVRTK